VTDLTNGTAYTFTVVATNANGSGTATSATDPVTPATIPGAPTSAAATAADARATVSWTAPVTDGGSAIMGYTVVAVDQTTAANGGQTCSTSTTSCSVLGLTSGDVYTFTVTATNTAGTGRSSTASVSVQVLGAPGAPTGVTVTNGFRQATIAWTAPTWTGGSAITSYVVSLAGQTCSTTGDTTCVVDGLTNGTPVTGTVVATNAYGTGLPAAVAANASATAPGFTSAGSGVTSPTMITDKFTVKSAATAAPTWTATAWLSATNLPSGVTFIPGTGTKAATGTLIATNLASGIYDITIMASNGVGQLTQQRYTLTSLGFIATPSDQTWTKGTSVSIQAEFNDPNAVITASGLPSGMRLARSKGIAVISGRPTTLVTQTTVTLKARNGSRSTTVTFTVAVR
jgi:predicted RNA-binding protein with TRAM domain